MNVVIVGGGIAGTTAAEEIRKRLPDATITILEREQHPVYSRVLLPHYLKGKVPRERVFLRAPEWYLKERIELLTGLEALSIDTDNQFVATSDGREYPYDKLLIASGGEPTLLNDDLHGVSYLHSIDDADYLHSLLRELALRPSGERPAVVYGGAFMACEYANIFKHHQVPFVMMLRGAGFWSQVLSPESQTVLANHTAAQGIRLLTHEPQPELVGEDVLRAVKTKSGEELPAAVLGAGIGGNRDEQFFAAAKIRYDNGVVANEFLETHTPNVWSAGDATAVYDSIVNRRVRYGNWANAQTQGRVAGQNMAGERNAFRLVSQYSTNLLGFHILFIGDIHREAADEVRLVAHTPLSSEEHFLRDGKLVGAVLLGDLAKRGTLMAKIGQSYAA